MAVKFQLYYTFVKKMKLDYITLENIRCYAHHGCLAQETKIGSDYRVDLEVEADLSISAKSDLLKDTVDYVHLNKIVKEEMDIPSKLLEHVAERISNRILDELPSVQNLHVQVAKINPPLGGDVQSVKIGLRKSR